MGTEPCPTCGRLLTTYVQLQCLHCGRGKGTSLLNCGCEDCREERADYLNEVQDRDE